MNVEYIYVTDINDSLCIAVKKDEIYDKYDRLAIDKKRIIVVRKEIESWYLAGVDREKCRRLRISFILKTDDVTKEQFESLMPEKFDSIEDFKIEILKNFSIEEAKRRNRSFKYFCDKYL